MECPHNCPSGLFGLMGRCWNWDPALRPDFKTMHRDVEALYLHLDEVEVQHARQNSGIESLSPVEDDMAIGAAGVKHERQSSGESTKLERRESKRSRTARKEVNNNVTKDSQLPPPPPKRR